MSYRVGHHQPRNLYRGDQYIGVCFDPADTALIVLAMEGCAPAVGRRSTLGDLIVMHGPYEVGALVPNAVMRFIESDQLNALRAELIELRGIQTGREDHSATHRCPNCGTPVDVARVETTGRADLAAGRRTYLWGTSEACKGCGRTEAPELNAPSDRAISPESDFGAPVVGRDTTGTQTPCCDLHGPHCEAPSELCCHLCTEAAHTGLFPHADGTQCVLGVRTVECKLVRPAGPGPTDPCGCLVSQPCAMQAPRHGTVI